MRRGLAFGMYLARSVSKTPEMPCKLQFYWWSRLVSNQRPSACEADALPLSYETGNDVED